MDERGNEEPMRRKGRVSKASPENVAKKRGVFC
jgi:hypothetical protein